MQIVFGQSAWGSQGEVNFELSLLRPDIVTSEMTRLKIRVNYIKTTVIG